MTSRERVAGAATIAAVSSPAGPAARGVVRVSGPDAAALALATLRLEPPGTLAEALARRGLFRARFDDGLGSQPALVLWMPGPASYTREDVLELHLPGAPPLVDAALARLLALGARRAERGEFTRRAFMHGRLDLTRAEGVLELVSAGTEAEARAATELLRGGLAARVGALREGLEELRALAEASLDFDEADTGHVPTAELEQRLAEVRARLDEALAFEVRRQAPSSLPRVVLVGAPNAGKSTLFNAAVGLDAALVSDHAGTTRDVLVGVWSLGPLDSGPAPAVLLVDTAGEDPLAEGVDREAQAFAARAAAHADLLLHVLPVGADPGEAVPRPFGTAEVPVLRVRSKADALPSGVAPGAMAGEVRVAAARGEGLADLARAVALRIGLAAGDPAGAGRAAEGASVGLGRELFARHRAALEAARTGAERAAADLAEGAPLDLVAEALRVATDALDEVAGRTTPEDLLDRIFARFCLGK